MLRFRGFDRIRNSQFAIRNVFESAIGSKKRLAVWSAIAISILFVACLCSFAPYRIPSASMEPTLRGHDEATGTGGDTVVVGRAAYLFADPARWDVVAFDMDDPDARGDRPIAMVKRVVGLPNEVVEIRDGELLVDGRSMDQPPPIAHARYLRRGPFGHQAVRLGAREYFVLGDHSYLSRDSREWGPVSRDRIFGKVLGIMLPWERAGWLSSDATEIESR